MNLQSSDLKLLEQFIYNNDELEELEQSFDKFNVFHALNIVNQEIRHSNFLGWLLDPSETHELGDYFMSKFIKQIHYNSVLSSTFSIFDLDSLKFDNVEVRREWRNIDILILDSDNKYFWLIENKVRSHEHSNQLKRYKDIAKQEFPDYKHTFIYLTIEGEDPSDNEYIPVGYKLVSDLIERLLESKSDKINSDISMFVSHYNQMIKTHIVSNTRIEEVCKNIYKNHKRALDLIFEHKPDALLDIKDKLVELIDSDPALVLEDSNKAYIRFSHKEMTYVPTTAKNWISSNRLVVFEFRNYENNLSLHLLVGPGNDEHRQVFYNHVQNNKKIFSQARSKLAKQFYSVWKKEFIKGKKKEDIEYDDLMLLIQSKFRKTVDQNIPEIILSLSEVEGQL